ncbi:hypothetical protein GF361_00120 [Candidatus Woesearchaeota archaeon]|nr:hypothetical protein [Candidatus Woesearchaeota archaeon]
MIQETLKKVGLTAQESRVYLKLLTLQEARTGLLCKETNIASSNIYKILDSLRKKGLVSYRLQNNIKVFMPSPPEALNELFIKKQKRLEQERKEVTEAISKLKTQKISSPPESNYKYHEGISGIKAMWHEINETMDNSAVMKIYTGKQSSFQRLIGFFKLHHRLRKKKKVQEQMIFPKEAKKLGEKRKDKLTKIKYRQLNNQVEWGVWKDIFYIHDYPVKKAPRGFLIKDKEIAKTFEQVFDQLWEKKE